MCWGGWESMWRGFNADHNVTHLSLHSLFSQCHPFVPPKHYYEACLFDSCFVAGSGIECASVQAYAALCAQEGICIDWRNHTQGVCCKCLSFFPTHCLVLGPVGQARVLGSYPSSVAMG